ncbi:MAG: hypothetical protein GC168_09450 [Candidatus Hydrogenedens sp.]|nr:hypothetical protein [Candidatus Hydrogenedens sp.]
MLALALFVLSTVPDALVDFSSDTRPENAVLSRADWKAAEFAGAPAARIDFSTGEWPHVEFVAAEPWDWSGRAGLEIELVNLGERNLPVYVRVDNAGANGFEHCNTCSVIAPPGKPALLRCRWNLEADPRLWGMRGQPGVGPVGNGATLDPAAVTAFQIFVDHPVRPESILLTGIRLFGEPAPEAQLAFPFVDRFGQYKHDDWPGKAGDEDDLAERAKAEAASLWSGDAPSAIWPFEDRDRYGGWLSGPEREATGWFRTEKLDGKWWLVTPGGRLFLSIGMDCVGHWQRTFVTGREDWFEWLPPRDDERFATFYNELSGAHSMAERIGGKGLGFGFYGANLARKYGSDWPTRWREISYRRLQSWGFNTLGNWSQHDVLANSPMPYVASGSISGVPSIQGAEGYWSAMFDVYDPIFPERVEAAVAGAVGEHARNPLCIGYFLDNELAWEGVLRGVLRSPAGQPARQALLRGLQETYADIGALNAAWRTDYADWENVREVDAPSDAMQRDLDDFLHRFAGVYFKTIAEALKRAAPHQLYLGCRFANCPEPVIRACAEYADVVSYNRYEHEIDCARFAVPGAPDKPVVIGEFHFGALDRGLFHGGLVPVESQQERAEAYKAYWRSIAACPSVVGAHWFQYIDEPNTGRYFDGENYNIGFIDVTDTPYPELTQGATAIHTEIYRLRQESE